MNRFLNLVFLITLIFATSSAGVIIPESTVVEEEIRPASANKTRLQLSRKALREMSSEDMAKILEREMSAEEKASFKSNRKKFLKDTNMVEVKRTNTMAIIGFVTSLILPPLGIIFGIIALGQIKKSGEAGKGWAIAGIIAGAVFTLYFVIMAAAWGGFAV